MIRIGSACLIVALLSVRFLQHPATTALQTWTDAAIGATFGTSFGFLLLGVRMKARGLRGESVCGR